MTVMLTKIGPAPCSEQFCVISWKTLIGHWRAVHTLARQASGKVRSMLKFHQLKKGVEIVTPRCKVREELSSRPPITADPNLACVLLVCVYG